MVRKCLTGIFVFGARALSFARGSAQLPALQFKAEQMSGQVKSSAISKDSILIGDQVLWSTRFELGEKDSIAVYPYAGVLERDTLGSKVEVVADFKLDTVAIKKGIKELEAKVLLTSFDSGSYKLPLQRSVPK